MEVTLDINAQLEVHDLSQDFPTICRKWDEYACHEVAQLTGCQKMSRETLEAYGHRIVACVNACRGIPTERLLTMDIKAIVELADSHSPSNIDCEDYCSFYSGSRRLLCSPDATS